MVVIYRVIDYGAVLQLVHTQLRSIMSSLVIVRLQLEVCGESDTKRSCWSVRIINENTSVVFSRMYEFLFILS